MVCLDATIETYRNLLIIGAHKIRAWPRPDVTLTNVVQLEYRIEQGTRLRRLDTKICSQCVRRSCGRPETFILGSSMDSYTDAELGSEVGNLLEEISQEIKTLKQELKQYKS